MAPGWYPDPAGGQGQRWHDGQGWTGQTSYAGPIKALGAPFARLGDWLARLLILSGVASLITLFFALWDYLDPDRMARITATGETDVAFQVDLVTAIAQVPIALATMVVWLVWQHRLAGAAPVRMRRSTAMHVGSWFIPIAWFWFPKQNMNDLFRAYESGPPGPGARPLVLSVWWSCWTLMWLVPALAFGPELRVQLGTATAADDQQVRLIAMLTAAVSVLAAGFAVQVVRKLSWKALLYHAT